MIFCARGTNGLRRVGRVAWSSSCSRNAHDKNVLAWANGTSWRASGWAGEKIARNRGATRLPLKINWRTGETCAMEDSSAPTPEDITNSGTDKIKKDGLVGRFLCSQNLHFREGSFERKNSVRNSFLVLIKAVP
jgi:hypothetical protein